MNKKIYWLFLFSTFLSFSQKSAKEEVIEKISTSVCECTSKRKIDKDNVKIGLGSCLLEAMNTHKTEMLKAYNAKKIDKNLIQTVGEAAGGEMINICPEVLDLLLSDEKFVNEIISDFSNKESNSKNQSSADSFSDDNLNVSGVYSETKYDGYLQIVVKEESGRINNFILLNDFDTSFLITDKVLKSNDKVKVSYYISDIYDYKINKFISFKIITNLTKL